MRAYQFKDLLYLKKDEAIAVVNAEEAAVGSIKKANLKDCEKGHAFSFVTNEGNTVSMGIKKRGLNNLLAATYIIEFGEDTYLFKDKPGNILLYFCVTGELDGEQFRIEENWQQEIEIKVDQALVATIKPNDLTFKTNIQIDEDISVANPIFGITILMYFMYKIYKNESGIIEDLLFD